MSNNRRSQQIDITRGIAILVVLFHHFNIAYPLRDTWLANTFGWDAVRAVARNGNYGVTAFFVVSGFLITSNALRRWSSLRNVDARTFYTLRAARILPCLVLLLVTVNLLAFAGIEIFQNRPENGDMLSFWLVNFASLTFWMNVLIAHHGWFNYALGVLWSLSVEEVFYLSFPLLCLLLRREKALFVFWTLIVIVGPLYRFAHRGDEAGFLYAYFASFDGIAIGCCAALLDARIVLQRSHAYLLRLVALVGMVALYLSGPIGETHVFGVTAMALGTAVLMLGSLDEPAAVRNRLDPRVWAAALPAWFGRHSYELYLFHLIALGALRTVYPPHQTAGNDKLVLMALFFALAAVLAAAIARFYAEPLNRYFRRRLAGRPVGSAARAG
ncbi:MULTISPECIES: acyltransferase [Paraburkholderia]|uniref:acyltransferase family protein n=1 Tax=Paraburkholderia TaxID=1822464 RepID=UPI0022543DD4|nr:MULTISPECIES: acyltransferase [Paraburkholderia]MCX4160109.1 acyltransferase [Paraburkholderia megapolitana]MDN7155608.1 acyltransferase [Paraburkholderia sp. CHISQ3]MDQ6492652.1 acyltransferase [Paraburkholderia megapolitana]